MRINETDVNTKTIIRFWVLDIWMPKAGRKNKLSSQVVMALNITLTMTSMSEANLV